MRTKSLFLCRCVQTLWHPSGPCVCISARLSFLPHFTTGEVWQPLGQDCLIPRWARRKCCEEPLALFDKERHQQRSERARAGSAHLQLEEKEAPTPRIASKCGSCRADIGPC